MEVHINGKVHDLQQGRHVRKQRIAFQPQNEQDLEAQYPQGQSRCQRRKQDRVRLLALPAFGKDNPRTVIAELRFLQA